MPRRAIGVMLRAEMSRTLDDDIRTRLGHLRSGIALEFDGLPEQEVQRRFDAIVEGLLDEATFGDFVPVLAWRYAREELSVVAGVPAEYAAD
jgi:hypothetical protein